MKGGLPAYLWFVKMNSNGKNMFKRCVIERAYNSLTKDEEFPQTIRDIQEGSLLHEYLVKTLKGKDEAPIDNMYILSNAERD